MKKACFVYFLHESLIGLKVVSNITLSDPDIVTIRVFWNSKTKSLDCSGCEVVSEWLKAREDWLLSAQDSSDPFALFKALLIKAKKTYRFKPHQIHACLEGNFSSPGSSQIVPLVVDLMNFIQPGWVVLPTGTPDCCRFTNYWIEVHGYPRLDLGRDFQKPEYFYDEKTLESQKAFIDMQVCELVLKFPAPKMLSVDKSQCAEAIRQLKVQSEQRAAEFVQSHWSNFFACLCSRRPSSSIIPITHESPHFV